jgi:hypothetical protein
VLIGSGEGLDFQLYMISLAGMGMLTTVGVVVSVGGEDPLRVTIALVAMAILGLGAVALDPGGGCPGQPMDEPRWGCGQGVGKGAIQGDHRPAGAAWSQSISSSRSLSAPANAPTAPSAASAGWRSASRSRAAVPAAVSSAQRSSSVVRVVSSGGLGGGPSSPRPSRPGVSPRADPGGQPTIACPCTLYVQ